MILEYTNNDANVNDIVDEVMISFSKSDGESNATKKRFNTGPTTSAVKRRAGKEIDHISSYYESVSMSSSFNEMLKSSPSPGNLQIGRTMNAYRKRLGNSEYTSSELEKIAGCIKLKEIAGDRRRVRR